MDAYHACSGPLGVHTELTSIAHGLPLHHISPGVHDAKQTTICKSAKRGFGDRKGVHRVHNAEPDTHLQKYINLKTEKGCAAQGDDGEAL